MQTVRDKSGGIRFIKSDSDIQKSKEIDRLSKIENRISILENSILELKNKLEKLESGEI